MVKMLKRCSFNLILCLTSSVAICQTAPHAILDTGSRARGINAFSALGGSWIWTTVGKWKTTLWYAPSPDKDAVALGVFRSAGTHGITLSYLPSPSGQKVLYRVVSDEAVRWTIFDRATGRQRHLKLPKVIARRLSDPIWSDESQVLLLDPDPIKKTSRSWQEIWSLHLKSGRLEPSRQNALVGGDALNGYIQYYLRYEKKIRSNIRLLNQFAGLPAEMSLSGHLDELSTVGELVVGRSWNDQRGGTLAILPGDTRVGLLESNTSEQNSKGVVLSLGATKPGLILKLKPLGRLDYVDKLRAASPTDLIFERSEYHPDGGVGANEVEGSGWDRIIHPSRYRTEILRWNLKTGALSFVTFGHNALRLLPLYPRSG